MISDPFSLLGTKKGRKPGKGKESDQGGRKRLPFCGDGKEMASTGKCHLGRFEGSVGYSYTALWSKSVSGRRNRKCKGLRGEVGLL